MTIDNNHKAILGYFLVQRVIVFLVIYDYLNRQIQETSSDETSGNSPHEDNECTSGACTKYVFAGSTRIASQTSSKTYFYHADHLGSAGVITDETGNWVEKISYYPYGEANGATDA
jgi:hypothetical protein